MSQPQYLIYIMLFLSSGFATAGTSVGNGGLVVSCASESGPPRLRVLDFVEAEIRWKLTMNDKLIGQSPFAIVSSVIEKMSIFDPARANILRLRLKSFLSEADFMENIELSRTDDEHNILVPKNCIILQAVIQAAPLFPEERLYNISADIWNKMDQQPIEQAGLIMHELLYREGIELGQTNSKRIRYFTAILFSTKFDEFSHKDYLQLLESVGFPFN
jgi:hypothetical protein